MKIALTGAQGTGKTTLANQIKTEFPEMKMLPEAARLALEAGYKLDQTATIETELWLILKQIELEQTQGSWVADRCAIDLLAYIHYLFPKEEGLIEVSVKTLEPLISKYDLIILLPSGQFPIEADGVRFVNQEFQEQIDKRVRYILEKTGAKFVEITGSPEERLNKVKELIKLSYANQDKEQLQVKM